MQLWFDVPKRLVRIHSRRTTAIQVLLFGVLAISLKDVAPSAHTVCEIVRARWGKAAHVTFLCFAFAANIIVTSMLLLGGAATVEALTGMDRRLASFLIPWGVILYTSAGGLKATFMASYLHTMIIFAVLITMVTVVYIKVYSSNQVRSITRTSVIAMLVLYIIRIYSCNSLFYLLKRTAV